MTSASSRGAGPRIAESIMDAPTQRLYSLSLGLLCQAIKVFDFIAHIVGGDAQNQSNYVRKWIIADSVYLVGLSILRIPRLNYSKAAVFFQLITVSLINGLLFGGIHVRLGSSDAGIRAVLPSSETFTLGTPSLLSDILSSVGLESLVGASSADAHLLGQHTVRMSPISTAQLNPDGHTFCLASPDASVLIPVLLNNTTPTTIRYSLTPLGAPEGRVETYDLSSRDLKLIEAARLEGLALTRTTPTPSAEDYDDYDEEDDDEQTSPSSLQKTQSITHIRLSKPGTLRLERIIHSSSVDARVVYSTSLTVAPCPTAQFANDSIFTKNQGVRCAGTDPDVDLAIDIYGVPPLSLRWSRTVNDQHEFFTVEGIEAGHKVHRHQAGEGKDTGSDPTDTVTAVEHNVAQKIQVPLTVSVDAVGTHVYSLESVVDGLGNIVSLATASTVASGAPPVPSNSKTTRALRVLRRPSTSFKGCGPGAPAALPINGAMSLTMATKDTDPIDGPWEISLQYQPPSIEDGGSQNANTKLKPWTKVITTDVGQKDGYFRATSPGIYTITGIRGQQCEGDVLNPESCKVVEMPYPSAEIEWKRIHECSGDTGVSASLVLHGVPPFQVYYRTQQDNGSPRELVRNFYSSRGEITLQPEQSGHYTYTFFALSDANYKKVELHGPTIEQVVHPLASVDFAHAATGGKKKKINSCSGGFVDVDIELKGTGPWTVEAQVVAPKSSELVKFPNITEPQTTLQVPIPKVIDAEGGSFTIDLVSVEDTYGCKRAISVPGVPVNVRRVKPTVKFYSRDGVRRIVILEEKQASLPLRLSGEGPWKVKYRRAEAPERTFTASLKSPNDHLLVTTKGTYELISVTDSQCPGSVVVDESTYEVAWVPRPNARLASGTQATLDSYTGSYSLPPVCENVDDHVDLELSGRPPFQLLYNIGRDSVSGSGTDLVDQVTFSSIQHRTRFQLYTSGLGKKYYEVKQIGDASYPLAKYPQAIIPRADRLLFTQEVLQRPAATFKQHNRLAYCLGDTFTARSGSSDGLIMLQGTPPFNVKLTVKNLAASETYTMTTEVHERSWKIDLPEYTFKSIGPHLVSIEGVTDASHCSQATTQSHEQSIWVDVAESAAIVPFDRREHFCVGDISQFQLEGIPPWTIGYTFNGKARTQEVKQSPFTYAQQQPGDFIITSIAHQQKMCRAAVADLRYTVHPLPSAKVGHGKRIVQNIHEGDQAEILFTLVGEPPFTFTYQRAEPSSKRGKPGKVLETHTVSGVTTREYSIFSALEGTWTVTFISDRYCRYPPTTSEGTGKAF